MTIPTGSSRTGYTTGCTTNSNSGSSGYTTITQAKTGGSGTHTNISPTNLTITQRKGSSGTCMTTGRYILCDRTVHVKPAIVPFMRDKGGGG